MRGFPKLWLLWVSGAAAPALAAADKPAAVPVVVLESVLTMRVDSQVHLDEKGDLVGFKIQTEVPPELHQALERAVWTWRFTPAPSPDGFTHETVAPMRLTLAATKNGDGYRVKVDNVIFPNKAEKPDSTRIIATQMLPPMYPIDQERQGLSGVVLLSLRLSTDGRVEEAVPVQSMLINPGEVNGGGSWAVKQFERAALRAARRWHFAVPATLASANADTLTMIVPVHFNAYPEVNSDSPAGAGHWRRELRTPRRGIPWLDAAPGRQAMGVSDMADGEVMPVKGLVSLDTDVVGMDVM